MKTFVRFDQIQDKDVIIIDGKRARGLVLSHWRGANTHAEICDDSSGAIAINAIKAKTSGLEFPYVTATHFDIDGLVGVWSVCNPILALKKETILKHIAYIGDFREIDVQDPDQLEALKIICWINELEKKLFYPPFGEEDELRQCAEKFNYFMPIFSEALHSIESFKDVWIEEYNTVIEHCQLLETSGSITKIPDIGLSIVHSPKPIHYYALFGKTNGSDIVMSIYPNNTYELEYKYTTWVDISSRPTLPRIKMDALVQKLNYLETSELRWEHQAITDSGPIVRLESNEIPKQNRYANPFERMIHSSNMDQEQFIKTVVDFFKDSYAHIAPKKYWTWKELQSLS